MTQPTVPTGTIKQQIIAFMESEYERRKKVDFSSQEVSNGLVGRPSTKLIGAYLTGLRRENVITNTGTIPGGNGRAVTFALVKVLEKETAPKAVGSALESTLEGAFSETEETQEESPHVTNDNNRKPRSGTPEHFLAKTNERVDRLDAIATKAVSKLDEATAVMNRAMSPEGHPVLKDNDIEEMFKKVLSEQFGSVIQVCVSMEKAWKKHSGDNLEIAAAIAKSLAEQAQFAQTVHDRTADMLDELTNADEQQRIGYRNGFSDGWTAAIHKLREEIGEAKSSAVAKSIEQQKANGDPRPERAQVHLNEILSKLSIL